MPTPIGNCGFCQVPEFFGRDIRSRDPDDIIEEINAFVKAGAKKIAISGGTSVHYRMDDDEFVELLRRVSDIVGPRNLAAPDVRIDAVNVREVIFVARDLAREKKCTVAILIG